MLQENTLSMPPRNDDTSPKLNSTQKRITLRNSIKCKKLVRAVGAYDAITARLAEDSGFEALWAGSLGICASLGLPDEGLIGMRELLDASRVLVNTTNLPVISDCDNGFGCTNTVIRLVREFEQAGIAGVCLEDQISPKRNSLGNGAKTLISRRDFSTTLRAATKARQDRNFLVIARVEALIAGKGITNALDRAKAYSDAGADIIAIHSKKESADEIIQFANAWANSNPILVIPTTYHLSQEQLVELDIAIVVFANQLLRIMISSAIASLRVLGMGGPLSKIPAQKIAPVSEIFRLQRLAEWEAL